MLTKKKNYFRNLYFLLTDILNLLFFYERGVLGAVLHHAGGGWNPAFLHGVSSGAVPSQGSDHLLGQACTIV